MLMDENAVRKRPWGQYRGMIASGVLHVIALAVLLYRPEPMVINPQSVRLGEGDKSYHVVYVPPNIESGEPEPVEHDKVAWKTVARKRHAKPSPVKPLEAPAPNPRGEVADRNANAGTIYGSIWALMDQGHDVKAAIPVEYPSPNLAGTELPLGVHGDVVVEVTIERDGSVTDAKLLQTIGHGVDERCLAAAQRWRFRPAILDGSPIASKHDVHFHFPS